MKKSDKERLVEVARIKFYYADSPLSPFGTDHIIITEIRQTRADGYPEEIHDGVIYEVISPKNS